MKLSGIFWTSILLGIFYFTFTLGLSWFVTTYLLWSLLGTIIHLSSDYNIFTYRDDIDFDEMWKVFLESTYFYLLPHLLIFGFCIGVFRGLFLLVVNSKKYLSTFNDKLDSVDLKPKPKPKKQSYGEFKEVIKYK